MTEYIEREIATNVAVDYVWGATNLSMLEIAKAINDIPAADVAPVRHAKWILKHRHRGGFRQYTGVDSFGETHTITIDERHEIDDPYCSECGKLNESVFLNYCPHCGAKMDGGK